MSEVEVVKGWCLVPVDHQLAINNPPPPPPQHHLTVHMCQQWKYKGQVEQECCMTNDVA